jgi:hypothetical protein
MLAHLSKPIREVIAGKAIAMFQPGTPKAGIGHRAEE